MSSLEFKLTAGDDNPSIEFQMLQPSADPEAGPDDKEPADLDGATVYLIYKVGATVYKRQCLVTDLGKAYCRYNIAPADKAVLVGPATYKARARAYWGDGTRLTFPNEEGEYISLIVAADPEL